MTGAEEPTGTYADLFTSADFDMETERIRLLARVFDPDSRELVESAGLRPGMRCLDLGAGWGSMTRWLAEQVAPGEVIALDRSPALVQRNADLPNVTVIEADITAPETAALIEPGSLDLIHVRALLGSLAEPMVVLERLYGWLAPGGVLVMSDMWLSPFCGTMGETVVRVFRVATDFMAKTVGNDLEWPPRLPERLAAVGLERVGMHVSAPVLSAGSDLAESVLLAVLQLRPLLVPAGAVTDDEIDKAVADLRRPGVVGAPEVMLTAWGYKSTE
jgi:SAM-dependent methyltransferase